MGTDAKIPRREDDRNSALEELRGIRAELVALRRLCDAFAGTYLNSRFQFGKPADRWRRDRD